MATLTSAGCVSVSIAATTATWVAPVQGDWNDPARWSTAPHYPNNGNPPGTQYDVRIGAAGAPYTIWFGLNSPQPPVLLDSLRFESDDARMQIVNSRLSTINGIEVNAGSLILAGGTLSGTIGGSGGTVWVAKGGLDAIVLRRDIGLRSLTSTLEDLYFTNGFTLDGGNVYTQAGFFHVRFLGTQTLGGAGTFNAPVGATGGGTVTIGPGIVASRGAGADGSTLVNRGTITLNGGFLEVTGGQTPTSRLINDGVIESRPGAHLRVDGNFLNRAGVMSANGGTLIIGDRSGGEPVTPMANLGNIRADGGTIVLGGTFDNVGNTFTADAATGTVELAGAVISGGTLAAADGYGYRTQGENTWLENVVLAADLPVYSGGSSAILRSRGTVTLDDATVRLIGAPGTPTGWLFDGAGGTIAGSGEIVFDEPTQNVNSYGLAANRPGTGTVTIAPGVVVRSGAGGGRVGPGVRNEGLILSQTPDKEIYLGEFENAGRIDVRPGASLLLRYDVTNAGTITVQGGTITAQENWTNAAGTIEATGGSTVLLRTAPAAFGSFSVNASTLALAGTISTAQLGQVQLNDATVQLRQNGVINNAGDTLTLNGFDLWFNGGTLAGGRLARAGGERLRGPGLANLSGVTVAMPLDLPGSFLRIYDDITLENVTITLDHGPGNPDGNTNLQFIDGNAIGGSGEILLTGGGHRHSFIAAGSLTFGDGITLRTSGGSVHIENNVATVTNNGTFAAESPGQFIHVTGPFTNNGLVRVVNGASLTLGGAWQNDGSITMVDSTLNLGGTFSTGGMGNLQRSGGTVNLTGFLNNAGATLALDAVTGSWNLAGGSVNGGSITAGGGAQLVAVPVGFPSALNGVSLETDVFVRPGAALRFNGSQNNATIHVDNGTLEFRGTVDADRIGALNRNNATIVFAGTYNNAGRTLDLDSTTDTWRLVNQGRMEGGTLASTSGARLQASGGTLSGVTLQADVDVQGSSLGILNGLTMQDSQINLVTSTGSPFVSISGTQTLAGTGEIAINGNAWCTINVSGGGTVTVGPGIHVRSINGAATFGSTGTTRIVNQGTISVERPQRWIALSGRFTNEGVIRAAGGGSISIGPVFGADVFVNTGTIAVEADGVLGYVTSFSNAGTIDVNGTMIVNYSGASPMPTLQEQLATGYAGGAWTGGPGITSSSARAAATTARRTAVGFAEATDLFATFPAVFRGVSVDSTTVLLQYVLAGDANLDGAVNLQDFNRLAANFGQTGRRWSQGDFTYDAAVNLIDFNVLAANFGFAAAGPTVTPQDWAHLASLVPEPGMAGAVACAAVVALARRRRHPSVR